MTSLFAFGSYCALSTPRLGDASSHSNERQRPDPALQLHRSLCDPTGMEIKDISRLLALPPELLIRITDNLHEESLPSLRLTCKTLEGATFDRFTETFRATYCCVYYESRWLSLKRFLNESGRLVRAVRYIVFTTDPLEQFYSTEVQLAPSSDCHDIPQAQLQYDIRHATEALPFEPLFVDKQASTALIRDVLMDVKKFAPHAIVNVDLPETRFFREESICPLQGIFSAIALTGCRVDTLTISRQFFDDCYASSDLCADLGTELLPCTSGLMSFTFESTDQDDVEYSHPLDEVFLEILVDILEATPCLTTLYLEFREFRHSTHQWTLTEKLLFANNMSMLHDLHLAATKIPEKQLTKAIMSCRCTLQHISLVDIRLMELEEGWLSIFQLLLTLPRLRKLALCSLAICEVEHPFLRRELDFSKITRGIKLSLFDGPINITLESRDDVLAGIEQLLSGPLVLNELDPWQDPRMT